VRPLVVTMQAFGPYAHRQEIDFAELGDAGFFLITGPTGSGKTTVLDAMSFALYGVASGGPESDGGRSGAAMRSDHAALGTVTSVTFDFALGADLYRIERLPEQERPRRRGEGTTRQAQEATIWRLRRAGSHSLEPDGPPLATGWTKVTAEAERLLGFRSEQFRQVVMLPQGRFQKLLEADSKEREQILRALFDTGHYARLELALKEDAARLRREAEEVATRRAEVLRQAESESIDDLADRCARLAADAKQAAQEADLAEAADKTAQQTLTEARETDRRLCELADAAALVSGLDDRDDEMAVERRRLEAAKRAASLVDVVRQADEAAGGLATARQALETAAASGEAAAEALDASREALEVEISRAPEREDALAEVRRLQGFADGSAQFAAALTGLAGAEAAVESRRVAAEAADAAWHEARDRLSRLEIAWHDAQAGLLAEGLHEGNPCPVCGATKHPAPATLPDAAPTERELDEARAGAAAALELRDSARATLQTAQNSHAAAAALAEERRGGVPADYADPENLQQAIAAATERADSLEAAHAQAQQAAHDADLSFIRTEAALTAARQAAGAAEKAAAGAAERLDARLAEARFETAADQRAALIEPDGLQRLEALVAGHGEAKTKAAERLRLAEAAAAGLSAPDLDRLTAAAAESAGLARSSRVAATGLVAAQATAEKLHARLQTLAEESQALEARYELIGRLADVANGANPRSLSFQRYVLGAFLDDVLVAASQRLHVMSKSRYRLERTERRVGGKHAAGLGLEVYDAWTGVARPVATLSGGEQFMAALSLALGLAEVVQANAGGIRLNTVFVDEGFGSLDDESLDLAVSSLMGLHRDGRLVGIISHVSELRERIDARLEISAAETGSEARFVVP